LASTKNYRQSVQRRGRLLRLFDGKGKAVLYDFVIIPPSFSDQEQPEVLEWERKLLESEFKRCEEFASLALNKNEVMSLLVALRSKGNTTQE
jgi:superfamily II DNA or RNA helicase